MNNEKFSITQIAEKIQKVDLEKKQKKAIFDIIDLKVNLEMEKVLFEIRNIRKDIEHFEKRFDRQSKIFYFLFGLVITFMTVLKLFS